MTESSFLQEMESRVDTLHKVDMDALLGQKVKARLIDLDAGFAKTDGPGDNASPFSLIDHHLKEKSGSSLSDQDIAGQFLSADSDMIPLVDSSFTQHPDLEKIIPDTAQTENSGERTNYLDHVYGDTVSLTPVSFSPINHLKSIILSLEWEISESILTEMENELDRLQLRFSQDQTIRSFLQMLRFLERHIKTEGNNLNIDSIKLLFSVYDDLEQMIVSKNMPDKTRQRILADNTVKFRSWSDQNHCRITPQVDSVSKIVSAVYDEDSKAASMRVDDPAKHPAGHIVENTLPIAGNNDDKPESCKLLAVELVQFKKNIHAEFENLRLAIRSYKESQAIFPGKMV